MLKKLLIGSLVVVGGGLVLMNPTPSSYIRMSYHSVRDTIRDQIPIDVEIKRARDLIENLKPEIAANLRIIAREEVEVEKLQKEVDRNSQALEKSKVAILRLKGDLESGVQRVSYGGKSYDMAQVKTDLADRFKHFQTQEATCDKLDGILTARQRNLDAARKKLDTILAAKRQHEVTVENLQARWTLQQVAEAGSQYSINDSALSTVRDTLEDIATRLDVAEKMVDINAMESGIPVGDESHVPEDIVDQITNYFGGKNDKFDVVAAKPASVLVPVDSADAEQQ